VKKRLYLELDKHGGLVVIAPSHWSERHINTTMMQNTARIARFMAKARRQQLEPLQYVDGEQHLFLGENHRLVVNQAAGKVTGDESAQTEIHVSTPRPTATSIKAGLQNWYRQQALTIFDDRLQTLSQRARWTRGKRIPLVVRRMKRTWGNCSSKGIIKINTHLVKAPLELIDSVIAHELCHLEEMNHGRAFYALLEGLNPKWQHDRGVLRNTGFVYLHE
jgi:predicted metal-dependent hydrolase